MSRRSYSPRLVLGFVVSACVVQRAEVSEDWNRADSAGSSGSGGASGQNGGGTKPSEAGEAGRGEGGMAAASAGGSAVDGGAAGAEAGAAMGGDGGSAGSGGAGMGGTAGTGGTAGAGGSGGPTGTSCDASPASKCGSESCCGNATVPGGSYAMGGSPETKSSAATISGFILDKYEVTVARFRRYVEAYAGPPAAGQGPHSKIAGSGWDSSWPLPADGDALRATLKCGSLQTWTDAAGDAASERRPINCINWYIAFAFCIWDGGRLPTDAEWEFAATGGPSAFPYAWGAGALDDSRANYDCRGDTVGGCSAADILQVGSKPAGVGKYGHLDLAGSVWEWTLDWNADYPPTCNDCANLTPSLNRSYRGGSFFSTGTYVNPRYRAAQDPAIATLTKQYVGIRCARNP